MSDSVEFRHLEYLLAIYEGKNFTRGAERVYRSQPAVSQQIRALEDDIGFPIFVRGGRDGVTPTPAGELVLNWAQVFWQNVARSSSRHERFTTEKFRP